MSKIIADRIDLTTSIDLAHMRVVVTRPAPEGAALCGAIESWGGQAISYPTIEITAIGATQHAVPVADITIFVSRNAVRYGFERFPQLIHPEYAGQIGAVGAGSAATFAELTGRPVDLIPEHQFDSDGLLALPALNNIADKVVHIIKGVGGRTTLQHQLTERGAQVFTTDCYQRILPTQGVSSPWDVYDTIDAIVTTSNETLDNLITLTPYSLRPQLLNTPVMVISKRGDTCARSHGFIHAPIVAPGADTPSILSALHQWQHRNSSANYGTQDR
jgi:uroporphyrinogen-III synthase